MTGRSCGAALTSGLAVAAIGLACLLGLVLRSSAQPASSSGPFSLRESQSQQRSPPARTRDGARDRQDKAGPKEPRPPTRLWRGPSPEKHPPRQRKALA